LRTAGLSGSPQLELLFHHGFGIAGRHFHLGVNHPASQRIGRGFRLRRGNHFIRPPHGDTDGDEAGPVDWEGFDRIEPLAQLVDRFIDHWLRQLRPGGDFVDDAFANELGLHVVAGRFAGARAEPDQLADHGQRNAENGQREDDLQQ
jgi:hypothetical protein